MNRELRITVSAENHQLLKLLADSSQMGTVEQLVEQLARAAADGVRRPGSWERGWIQQATGFPRGDDGL